MKVHFIGIAGQMMAGLAAVAKSNGHEVSGSDENAYPPSTTTLEHFNISWTSGHSADNLGDPDIVVLGNHIRENNVELQAAVSRGLRVLSYPEFIEMAFTDVKNQIIIGGTHGKSTTTSLLGWILDQAGLSPTVLIGAIAQNFENSFKKGGNEYLVIEGDEYSSSCLDKSAKFLHYRPTIGVITSIELDHMDLYKTIEDQVAVFQKFAKNVTELLLICGDAVNPQYISRDSVPGRVETYGMKSDNDWIATDIFDQDNLTSFSLSHHAEKIGSFSIPLNGMHNIYNATAAIIISLRYNIAPEVIQSALSSFKGVGKRFDIKGEEKGVLVVEDYAHHPTAIKLTLAGARSRYPHRKIWCVYEPHTYSRIKGLLSKFSDAFIDADETIIADIFPAREKALEGLVHSREVVAIAQGTSPSIHYIPSSDEILEYLTSHVSTGDIVLIMAVGNMGNLSSRLLQNLLKMV